MGHRITAIARLTALALACLALASACGAWWYDSGIPQHAGLVIHSGSNNTWGAAPFILTEDAYVTQVGAAIGRVLGPADQGFDVYLTRNMYGLPDTAFGNWRIIPTATSLDYYYVDTAEPIFLKAGVPYALIFVPSDPSFWGAVSYGTKPGTYIGMASPDYGQSWFMLSFPLCIRLDGYVVPEPSTFAALAVFIAGAFVRKRTRVE